MSGSVLPPSIDALKSQAKRLRATLTADGNEVSHSKSLEMLARQHDYKDWNTLYAAAGNEPCCPVSLGERVRGEYLGQKFVSAVVAVAALQPPGRFRVTFHFDEAVDVVTFESYSNFRQRVSCVLGANGVTAEKTSDGKPQLTIALNQR